MGNRLSPGVGYINVPPTGSLYPQTLKGDTISNMNVPQNLKTEEEWQSVRHFLLRR